MNILKQKLEPFCLDEVKLLDSYELNAFELEKRYLLSLDEDRLLRGFCDIAKIESTAELTAVGKIQTFRDIPWDII